MLSESVQTGEPAFDLMFGQNFFSYLNDHPDEAAVFNRVMTQEILWTTAAVLRAYDFSRFKRIVDVGGGLGLFLSHVLRATPNLEGILFDQPQVVAGAAESFKGNLAARAKIVGGSFFDRIPEGGDAYLLRRIIHDWDDEEAVKILRNVRASMSPGGILLLVEGLVDSPTQPVGLMDLMMLVLGGRERTQDEFMMLVQTAGFSLNRVIPAGTYSLIECKLA
jgi:SAM-dependent methyltransferase